MRAYIIFLTICLGVLTIPDGFFSHDRSMDSVAAEYDKQDTVHTIDMSIFEETAVQAQEELILDLPPIQKTLPPAVQIHAPYYSQAPDGNWKLPWSMLCSEANLALAAYAVRGKPLSKEQFKKDMLAMIPIQEKAFGTYFSIPMRDLKSLYDTMYPDAGTSRILVDPSIADMKKQLARGNLIIAPTAGRLLNNPFFLYGGPRFHTILIIGYDDKYFYTNEVGMSNGANYRYTHDTVMYAMHDFVKDGDITQGAKLVMIVER